MIMAVPNLPLTHFSNNNNNNNKSFLLISLTNSTSKLYLILLRVLILLLWTSNSCILNNNKCSWEVITHSLYRPFLSRILIINRIRVVSASTKEATTKKTKEIIIRIIRTQKLTSSSCSSLLKCPRNLVRDLLYQVFCLLLLIEAKDTRVGKIVTFNFRANSITGCKVSTLNNKYLDNYKAHSYRKINLFLKFLPN